MSTPIAVLIMPMYMVCCSDSMGRMLPEAEGQALSGVLKPVETFWLEPLRRGSTGACGRNVLMSPSNPDGCMGYAEMKHRLKTTITRW
jgi:hypothetical protein